MSTSFVPQDQELRERIISRLDETFFVEAGAGTGKTEILVNRIVALITTGRARISDIAAITFSELAAAELRERVRSRLLAISVLDDFSEREKTRCQVAVQGFDAASIQTLHSFAGQLLRERPLDIGVPPSFEVVEAIEADLSFRERWETWLDEVLASMDSAYVLRMALGLGLSMDQLRSVASSFHDRYDLIGRPFPSPPIPDPKVAEALLDARKTIESLLLLAHREGDPLAVHARKIKEFADRLERMGPNTDMAISAVARLGKLSFTRGKASDWDEDPKGRGNGCKALKALLSNLEALKSDELDRFRTSIICRLLEKVRQLSIDYAKERVKSGKIEFQDLLVIARNLLRDKPIAREHFKNRFTYILIDEFQDTDPLQAEIALLLCSKTVGPKGEIGELTPGKLFVVGDPKQSIYLFRGADVSVSEDLKKMIHDGHISLSQNFRSQQSIISWVNTIFQKWSQEDSEKAGHVKYHPIYPRWNSQPDERSNPTGVRFIGSTVKGRAVAAREAEADAVADVINRIKEEKWLVRKGDDTALQEAKYQDVCLLLPTRTGLEILETALAAGNIPYRVESQSMVLGTQDVKDLLNCLRAIDSPADQIALVAALRSFVFSCSDEDILNFVRSVGELDYMVVPVEETGPVSEALAVLARFHRLRIWTNPEELIERFIRDTRILESCFALARPRERWRRVRFVIDRAAAFASVSNTSLRSYLDWIERQAKDGARMIETPVPEPDEDAVRIMTIHASKGLEFPIVLLVGLGSPDRLHTGPVIYDRKSLTVEASLPALGIGRFSTPGYADARIQEQEKMATERTRQMYVAATRARDHLVVSLFRPEKRGNDSSLAAAFEQKTGKTSDLWEELLPRASACKSGVVTVDGPNVTSCEFDSDNLRQDWLKQRKEVARIAGLPVSIGATDISKLPKEEVVGGDIPYRKGRGGSHIGRAVHSTLQSVDLSTGQGLHEISQAQAAAEGLRDRWAEVAKFARIALDSDVVKAAVASGRYFKEVYVAAPVGSVLLEGFVDLVYESEDGLVVIDYKTDGVETADEIERSMERYRLQGGSYALALGRTAGKSVARVVFLFLHSGQEVVVDNLPGAMDDVQGEINKRAT